MMRTPLLAIALLGLAPAAAAQDDFEDVEPAGWYDRFVELALSDENLDLGYRQLTVGEAGYVGAGLVYHEDDHFALHGKFVRMGDVEGTPLRLGVGIAAHAAFLDRPNANAYGLGLVGLAEYDLPAWLPTTMATEVAYAPDITTFDDGEQVLDASIRLQVDISEAAAAFVGYRLLDVDVGPSVEVAKRFQVGIRLGF